MTANEKAARLLIDQMLSAQSRFASGWEDGPLTEQQRRDEVTRDTARAKLMELIHACEQRLFGSSILPIIGC